MAGLSWDEIVERGKQFNKTVLCEAESVSKKREYLVRCNVCKDEFVKNVSSFHQCKKCFLQGQKSTKEYFIKKAKEVHNDKYNYDLVVYVNSKIKIKIRCNSCENIFDKRPDQHLAGQGCSKCNVRRDTSTTSEFIEKARQVHNDKFNYDLVEYVNSKIKIKVFCNSCNIVFQIRPDQHLYGQGCRKCANNKLRSSKEDFILKAQKIHFDKYNYDLVDYKQSHLKVKILCNKCNKIFLQAPNHHIRGNGCKYCSYSSNTEDFILKAQKVHFDRYNYDRVKYNRSDVKVEIFCNKCQTIFLQSPGKHLSGKGCPVCNESKGENKIAKYLSERNMLFIRQKNYKEHFCIKRLKFDFLICSINALVEYDGEGHYKPTFGSTPEAKQKNLEDTQRRDKLKDEWALKNNIPLLRIPYWDFDRIEELIDAFILEHTKKEVKQLVLEM